MIEIIISVISAFFLISLHFYLTRKIKNHTTILLFSTSLLVILLLFNLFINNPIITFIITFTIFMILLLFILEVIKPSHALNRFHEEKIKE